MTEDDDRETKRSVTFEVTINGKPYGEAKDVTVLTVVAEQMRHHEAPRVTLHAGAAGGAVQLLTANLSPGDEIVVRIVETMHTTDTELLVCSFCGRDQNDVSALVNGPSAAICDGCIHAFSDAIRDAAPLPLGASLRDDPECACGFCGNRPSTIPGVVFRNGAAICAECLHVSVDIVEGPS